MYYAKEFVERLQQSEKLVIYGARIVAKEVANCLMGEPYNLKINGFMVTDMNGNPDKLCDIPVVDIHEGKKLFQDALILVAVLERYLDEILDALEKEGFHNVVPVTFECDLWSELRGNYYRELREKDGLDYLTLEEELEKINARELEENNVHIYMAKCHVDKVLQADTSQFNWELPIQVGAALTDIKIANIQDNVGDNISEKNREYCELTALYWIWKNDKSKYAGLCHYRRHFDMVTEDLAKLEKSDIDVVVTIPILNFPSVGEMYANDHSVDDWGTMMKAIEKLSPEYITSAKKLQHGKFYYAYNMFIARKEILDDYCAWLFPILEYCEKKIGKKENTYQNRYVGFLAERLLSIYVLHNQDRYKIVHAKKKFLMK